MDECKPLPTMCPRVLASASGRDPSTDADVDSAAYVSCGVYVVISSSSSM